MSTKKLNLILGFHSDFPYYNLKTENEITKEKIESLNNFLNLLNTFPKIKTNAYFSAALLTLLDKKYNDFSSRMTNMLDKKHLELFTGGIYDPIFPIIPRDDRQVQIKLMTRFLHHTFGYTPNGAWTTESAWDGSFPIDLSKSRISYTCLPEELFINAGIDEEKLTGYFTTEDEGRKVSVFPYSCLLNTLVKNSSPEDAIKEIKSKFKTEIEDHPKSIFYTAVINIEVISWFKKFFELVSSDENIETILFNEASAQLKSHGRVYIPTSSINVSGKWQKFLTNSEEANLLHKKMLRVSKKINAAKEGKSRFKVIKEMINQAHDLLLKGQNKCLYFENNYGGIYSPSERKYAYADLIKAENLIDKASRPVSSWVQLTEIDYDCDGNDEIILETETQNIYISPVNGGTILEHDFRFKNTNLTNTYITGFNYPKHNLIDHFLSDINLDDIKNNSFKHLTSKIIFPYNVDKVKAKEQTSKATMYNEILLDLHPLKPTIHLIKSISVKSGDSSSNIIYNLTNKSNEKINIIFSSEFNFNIPENDFLITTNDKNTENLNIFSLEKMKDVTHFSIFSKQKDLAISLSWNLKADLYKIPIETTCMINLKETEIIQGLTLFPAWQLSFEPNEAIEIEIIQKINSSELNNQDISASESKKNNAISKESNLHN